MTTHSNRHLEVGHMAIKTTWPLQHTCGQREDHDLSAKRR